jgi:hypothetical protein
VTSILKCEFPRFVWPQVRSLAFGFFLLLLSDGSEKGRRTQGHCDLDLVGLELGAGACLIAGVFSSAPVHLHLVRVLCSTVPSGKRPLLLLFSLPITMFIICHLPSSLCFVLYDV